MICNYKYIIFDLDGTLLDTSEGIIKSINYTLKELGYPDIPNEEKYSFIGPPIKKSLQEKFALSENEANLATDIFRNRYKDFDLYFANLYMDIIKLLDLLLDNNIYMAVATYKREDYALKLLKYFNLNKYFSIIKGSDFSNKMSKVDIINSCLIYKNIKNNEILMIGDTYSDYTASKKLSIDFLGVTYGFGFKIENNNNYHNIKLANSVLEVINFIKKGN